MKPSTPSPIWRTWPRFWPTLCRGSISAALSAGRRHADTPVPSAACPPAQKDSAGAAYAARPPRTRVQRVAERYAFPAISPATAHPEARSSFRFTIMGASSAFWISTVLIPRFDELDERYLVQLATHIQTVCWFEHTTYSCNKQVERNLATKLISTPAIIRIFTHSKKKPTVGLYACRRFLLFIRLSSWPPIRGRSSPQLSNRRCSPSDIDTRLSPRHSHSPSRRCAPHIPACSGRSPRRPSP